MEYSECPQNTKTVNIDATQDRITQLRDQINLAMDNGGYGAGGINSINELESACEELRRYNYTDYIANSCLIDIYRQNLAPEGYRRTFDSIIECIRLALSTYPMNERQAKAEEYYTKLFNKIQQIINDLENEFQATPISDLLGFNPRAKFAKKNASRDKVIFESLYELSRIPYLSDSFLDKMTEVIIKRFHTDPCSYQTAVWGYANGFENGTFRMQYFAKLEKNYPEYVNRSTKATEIKTQKEGCYIATAVYGSYCAPPVMTLRFYRDNVMRKHFFGRVFIKVYYALSPSVARKMKGKNHINSAVRKILDKFVERIEKKYIL